MNSNDTVRILKKERDYWMERSKCLEKQVECLIAQRKIDEDKLKQANNVIRWK